MAVLAGAVYYITDARTDFIVMEMTAFATLFIKKISQKHKYILENKIIKIMYYIIPVMVCTISWWITAIFTYENAFLTKLNDGFISNRLSMGKQAIDDYGITLFGKYVIEMGYGGSTDVNKPYFFIDSSYISIGIKYGIIMLILFMIFTLYSIKKVMKKQKYLWIIMLIMVSLQSFMEHHMIQYWYNVYILLIFAEVNKSESYKDDQEKIINLNLL